MIKPVVLSNFQLNTARMIIFNIPYRKNSEYLDHIKWTNNNVFPLAG